MARLPKREPMVPEVFYESFYAGSGLPKEVVLKLLEDLERLTEIPRTLLRPEDRLWEGEDVDSLSADSLQTVELMLQVEEIEEETGRRVEADTLDTVDQYIRSFGPLERQRMMKQGPRKQA